MNTPPRKIGKYDIVEPLGKGAMGILYKGFDPLIKRYVALKTIQLEFSEPQDDDITQRFHREAQAAGNLNHPNIVGIYEYGEDNGRAYIAMEYVEGQTLAELIKQKHAFTLNEIHSILTSVFTVLDYSHRKGVIHRDIKPGNIMINNAGKVKVMDFGIARIESSELTQTGTILGTPGYMSPEQLIGEKVDFRTDIYSAGIVLYEMLTGERAYTGSSFASVIYKIINNDLPPPSNLKPTLPETLDVLVAKACAKQAKDRYQSAAEFSSALKEALAASHDAATRSVDHVPPGKPPTHTPSEASSNASSPSRKRVWAFGATVVVACLALAGWFLRPSPPVTETVSLPEPGSTFKDCDTCPEMVVLPGGGFMQGESTPDFDRENNESQQQLGSVKFPLAISRYEITKAEFERFANETGHDGRGCNIYDGTWSQKADRSWKSPGFAQGETHPATCISWKDASDYLRWLSDKTGEKYRLLSEAEWEYAALAGNASGRTDAPLTAQTCESANVADRSAETVYPGWRIFDCRDRYVHTAPVGSYRANAFGIHDMLGNVFEWVADCWDDTNAETPQDGNSWKGGDCQRRVLRGGSWFTAPEYVRVSFRNRFDADYRSSSFGFRVAKQL